MANIVLKTADKAKKFAGKSGAASNGNKQDDGNIYIYLYMF